MSNQKADPPPDTLADGREEVVERIVASRPFARSPRLIALLRFLVKRCLAGQSRDLTEPEIALRVFERGKDFDPSADNIVRVTIRQVRSKLAEYYQDEGSKESWVLEIPKGGYVPTFRQREMPALATPVPALRDLLFYLQVLSLVSAAVLGVVCLLLWRENKALNATGVAIQAATDTSLVAEAVLHTSRKTTVVPTDSGQSLRELIAGRSADLNEYTGKQPWPAPASFTKPEEIRLWNTLETRLLTHTALFNVVQRMMKQNPAAEIILKHPRILSARDFKEDSFVLLGGTNPWAQLFESRLNFILIDGPGGFIRNRAPVRGEQAEYHAEDYSATSGRSYARVALVPNLLGNGNVLLIAGLGPFRTEAAGDFVLRPASASLVRKTLGLTSNEPLPSFELLVETVELDRSGISARILAWRLYR